MFDWLLYVSLVFALAIGFFLGCRYTAKKKSLSLNPGPIDEHYFKGLNFLLNEQPDAAIDAFISALEVNSDTLDTHVALGNLLRKKGEVDRAIRIHQNLLARPGLTLHQTQYAQYELATDFIKAGLFDRAEGLLEDLVSQDGQYKIPGLKRLLEVYRDEKEWRLGLDVLQKLSGSRLSRSYDEWLLVRAHFCCELAEEYIFQSDYLEARQWLKQALGYDKQSMRAGLLLGRLEIAVGELSKGRAQLKRVAIVHVEYIAEILPHLSAVYDELNDLESYPAFLSFLYAKAPDVSVSIALAEIISKTKGRLEAAKYISGEVIKYPSAPGLYALLGYYLEFSQGATKEYLLSLESVMTAVISNQPSYQCRHCGFKAKKLHWLCPSCKKWETIKPKRS